MLAESQVTYEAVIFDLFGTLIDNLTQSGYRAALGEMAAALDVPADDFAGAWKATMNDRMAGRYGDMRGNIRGVCEQIGVCPDASRVSRATEIRLAYTGSILVPREDVTSTLVQLHAMGTKIGLVSDCTAEVPHLWVDSPFAPLFDAAVFSCVEGVTKPDPRIYLAACERLAVTPEKCVYVGDGSSQELTGARQIGMHPVLISGPELDLDGVDRSDFAGWDGARVSTLSEVLDVVRGANQTVSRGLRPLAPTAEVTSMSSPNSAGIQRLSGSESERK